MISLRALSLMLSIVIAAGIASTAPAQAQSPVIPSFWDTRERIVRPDLSEITRLRFLTTVDFPPFNYIDATGSLTGFHVDLAREICRQLNLEAVCQIQALPWEELQPALQEGNGEAIIAGLEPTAELRQTLAFSRSFMKFPARFVVGQTGTQIESVNDWIAGKRVGVLVGTTHRQILDMFFTGAQPILYSTFDLMVGDLRRGTLDAVFGDGMRLSFWLDSADTDDCCTYLGGPYMPREFTGAGLTIAVPSEDASLAQAMNFALREIDASGKFAELYLRYFPISFY